MITADFTANVTAWASVVIAAVGLGGLYVAFREMRTTVRQTEMPFVIALPRHEHRKIDPGRLIFWDEEKPGHLALSLCNVGKGPATIAEIELLIDDNNVLPSVDAGDVIAPYGERRYRRKVEGGPPDKPIEGELIIHYTHPHGDALLTRSRVILGPKGMRCKTTKRERRRSSVFNRLKVGA